MICITGNLLNLVSVVDIPPMPIDVALTGTDISIHDCCTKRGFIPLQCSNGTVYWQLCFYCANAAKTIILPQAILASSDVFHSWMKLVSRSRTDVPALSVLTAPTGSSQCLSPLITSKACTIATAMSSRLTPPHLPCHRYSASPLWLHRHHSAAHHTTPPSPKASNSLTWRVSIRPTPW